MPRNNNDIALNKKINQNLIEKESKINKTAVKS